MSGWICLHRKILDHWIYQEPDALKVWITMLLEANHEANKFMFNGALVEVKRGQFVTGRKALSAKTGVSEKKIRRYLELLEKEGMVGQQKSNKYSIITITNYAQYQDKGQQRASKGPGEGQQRATNNNENNENNKSCPVDEIRALWNETCTNLPKVRVLSDKVKTQIKNRWDDDEKFQTLEFWSWLFAHVNAHPFLAHQAPTADRDKPWRASLEFVTTASKFAKILNEEY